MSRAVDPAPCRACLRCWSQSIAHAASFLGFDAPFDMVVGRIVFNTVVLAFPFAIREFGRGFPSLPAHFAIQIVSRILEGEMCGPYQL